MSKRFFFGRECPTCGRRLHICVEYLGKTVGCPHCGARLEAVDVTAGDLPVSDSLMQRVDELLETQADQKVNSSRLQHPR